MIESAMLAWYVPAKPWIHSICTGVSGDKDGVVVVWNDGKMAARQETTFKSFTFFQPYSCRQNSVFRPKRNFSDPQIAAGVFVATKPGISN